MPSRYCLLWHVMYRQQCHCSKWHLLGRRFHTLIRNVLFPSPTDIESHNPPLLGDQCLRWHTTRCLALIPFVTTQAVLKPWGWRRYVTSQNRQYLLAMSLGCYKWPPRFCNKDKTGYKDLCWFMRIIFTCSHIDH